MRLFYTLFISTLLLTSCNNEASKKGSEQSVQYYYLEVNKMVIDTTYIKSLDLSTPQLDLLDKKDFLKYLSKDKTVAAAISKYYNPSGPIDGVNVTYWEPHVGVFFERNTAWPIYRRLKCTNDSIDEYISTMIDHILADPKFSSNPPPPPRLEHPIQFIPPTE